jgi:hypothetical protein
MPKSCVFRILWSSESSCHRLGIDPQVRRLIPERRGTSFLTCLYTVVHPCEDDKQQIFFAVQLSINRSGFSCTSRDARNVKGFVSEAGNNLGSQSLLSYHLQGCCRCKASVCQLYRRSIKSRCPSRNSGRPKRTIKIELGGMIRVSRVPIGRAESPMNFTRFPLHRRPQRNIETRRWVLITLSEVLDQKGI